jgi:hypothetical protein
MTQIFNQCLTNPVRLLLAAAVLFLAGPGARAQDASPEAYGPQQQVIDPSTPVLIELFSSQACVFCPQADRLFADLAQQPGIIGLACHIDYLDVRKGSLARPFCTERQAKYLQALQAGPHYTPQMVINGRTEIIGYHRDEIIAALRETERPAPIQITPQPQDPGSYTVNFKIQPAAVPEDGAVSPARDIHLWLALYDAPHDVTIADGRNKNQRMTYYNIVSALKDIGPAQDGLTARIVMPGLQKGQAGFVIFAQDMNGGAVLAVGEYKAPAGKTAGRSETFGPQRSAP